MDLAFLFALTISYSTILLLTVFYRFMSTIFNQKSNKNLLTLWNYIILYVYLCCTMAASILDARNEKVYLMQNSVFDNGA